MESGKEIFIETKVNREHKDRLFCLLFGREENKANALALYNALNGTNYDNLDDLKITTLQDAVYIRMRNDVSILIRGDLSLYEQQSDFSENLPVRGMMYFSGQYGKYIEENGLKIYGKKMVKIPTPKFIVFFNGTGKHPAVEKLRLSNAFINPSEPGEFEWTATVINLNHPDNKELLAKCEPLADYTAFVARIRKYRRKTSIEAAVDRAVQEFISQENSLSGFLRAHRAEVKDLFVTEFNEDLFRKSMREEGYEEGLKAGQRSGYKKGRQSGLKAGRQSGLREGHETGHRAGLQEGRQETLLSLVHDGLLDASVAAKRLGISQAELLKLMEASGAEHGTADAIPLT